MITTDDTTKAYSKIAQILFCFVAFFFIMYIGKPIIVPLAFAMLVSLLLNPLVNLLHRKKIGRVFAIFLTVLLAMLVLTGVLYFIISQASRFTEALPLLKTKLYVLVDQIATWASNNFNVDRAQIKAWLGQNKNAGVSGGMSVVGQTIGAIGSVLVVLLLLPVYTFMILFYKPLLLDFLRQLFHREKHDTVAEVLVETKSLVQNYLLGLLIEAAIVATLNTIGLLAIGVPYAFLIGVIGALLNMIPYIGGLVAISIPFVMALVTQSTSSALLVLALYAVVQFIDNNIIVPRIVASRVKLNALVSIVVVLVGGAIWGVAGMFLAIPFTAIVKVVCDRVEGLKPWGFLLGDTMPPIGKSIFKFSKFQRKPKPAAS